MSMNDERPRPAANSIPTQSDADRLRERIKAAGLGQRAAARELGVDDRTMRYWCAGDGRPPEMAYRALDPRARHYAFLKQTIRSNEQQIELFEAGKMTCGYGPEPAPPSSASQEIRRLRQQNEELQVLVRMEDAFQRRQTAFFAVHSQWLPHGDGSPSQASLDELDAAEAAWRAAQAEMERLAQEIRAGRR
jgi:hypothetical protein